MRAYGIPRIGDLDGGVDCTDLACYGLKSSRGHLPGKGGDIKSSIRGPKASHRRPWKKIVRARVRQDLHHLTRNSDLD